MDSDDEENVQRQYSQMTTFKDKFEVAWDFRARYIDVNRDKINKTVGRSMIWREIGNKEYTTAKNKDYLRKSIEAYTKSIAFAPLGSKELSLAYAKRSAVLFKARLYEDCLLDIERSLKTGYPDKLKTKLFLRQSLCFIALKPSSHIETAPYNDMNAGKTEKTVGQSMIWREVGNKEYTTAKNKDYLRKSIEAYTESIAFAPLGSKELSLAYANRSAVLFKARLYEDCLLDIERSLKAGYPDKLKTKLFLRQLLCFKALKPNSELEPSISMANATQWLPNLKKYNPKYDIIKEYPKMINELEEPRMNSDAIGNIDRQYDQKTTFRDKFKVTWNFSAQYMTINHEKINKTVGQSMISREIGNKEYTAAKNKDYLRKSIGAYTESIAFAPLGSKELSLAYANRSAVLFRARLYEDCLLDIERSLKAGYPDKLKTKLFLRQSLCFKALKPNSKLEADISMANAMQWQPDLKKYNPTYDITKEYPKMINDLKEPPMDFINLPIDAINIANRQYSQKTTFKDKFSEIWNSLAPYLHINHDKIDKTVSQSMIWREVGNKEYTTAKNKDYLRKSIEAYTKSIAFAPAGSEELSLAYANRSAVLFRARLYEDCLLDIERSLKLDYPDRLKTKLFLRQSLCLKALKPSSHIESEISMANAMQWQPDLKKYNPTYDLTKEYTKMIKELKEPQKKMLVAVMDFINPPVDLTNAAKCHYSQKTTFRDKFEVAWNFITPYITINHDKIDKTVGQSMIWREIGNKEYTTAKNKDYLSKSIKAYSESIAFAPLGSKELSLAYANRSAVLFRARHYEDCLLDIERALKSGYPDKLKTKLYLRQSLCFKALKPNSKLEADISMASAKQWLPNLKKYNPTYDLTEEYPKMMNELKEPLMDFIKPPVDSKNAAKRQYSQKTTFKDKFKVAWDFAIPYIKINRDKLNKTVSQSMIWRKTGNKEYTTAKNKDYLRKSIEAYTKSIAFAPVGSKELSLAYANRSAVLFKARLYEDCLLDIERSLKAGYPDKLKTKLFLRQLLCLKALKPNSGLESERDSSVVLSNTMIPFLKILKPSCDPNVDWIHVGSNVGYFAVKPIKQGEPILESIFGSYHTVSKTERYIGFGNVSNDPLSCECTACVENWSTIHSLPSYQTMKKKAGSNVVLSNTMLPFLKIIKPSCDPNVNWTHVGSNVGYYACKPIKQGKLLLLSTTDSYHMTPKIERYARLGPCQCKACVENWPTMEHLSSYQNFAIILPTRIKRELKCMMPKLKESMDFINIPINAVNVARQQYSQKTTLKDRFAVIWKFISPFIIVSHDEPDKMVDHSMLWREIGNKEYTTANHQDYLRKSIEAYTKSIAFAPVGSSELSLAYAKRSAVLFKARLYEDCLLDIDRSINLGYPDKFKTKLFLRQSLCFKALKPNSGLESVMDSDAMKNDPQQYSQVTTFKDKFEVAWIFIAPYLKIDINHNKIDKTVSKSKNWREIGNREYTTAGNKDYLLKSIEAYTKSIAHAPAGSKELSLAYANRSAVLFRARLYEDCLLDIERSLKAGHPKKLKTKLFLRQSLCFKALKPNSELEPRNDSDYPLICECRPCVENWPTMTHLPFYQDCNIRLPAEIKKNLDDIALTFDQWSYHIGCGDPELVTMKDHLNRINDMFHQYITFPFMNFIKPPVDSTNAAEQQFLQKTTFKDKFEVAWNCITPYYIINHDKINKTVGQSMIWREVGNKEYTTAKNKDYLWKSIEAYTKSIAFAPVGSSELSLAYANRSAVLFKARLYKDCLLDIERSLKAGYPDKLKTKLFLRQSLCFKALKLSSEPEAAWNSYHNIECLVLASLVKFEKLTRGYLLAVKLFLKTLNSVGGLIELKRRIDNIDSMKNKGIIFTDGILDVNTIDNFLNLDYFKATSTEFMDFIKPSVNLRYAAEQQYSQKTTFRDKFEVAWNFITPYFIINHDEINKTAGQSIIWREIGNKEYISAKNKDYLCKSIEAYTKSIAHAPVESTELSLAYANRSAVLFKARLYQDCLLDIERSLKAGYPDKLKTKLFLRQSLCFKALKPNSELDTDISMASAMQWLPNLKENNPNYNIKDEYSKIVNQLAWDSYHSTECLVLGHLLKFDNITRGFLSSVKLFLKTLNSVGGLIEIKKKIDNIDSMEKKELIFTNGILDFNTIDNFLRLDYFKATSTECTFEFASFVILESIFGPYHIESKTKRYIGFGDDSNDPLSCECTACVENWPTIEHLPSYQVLILLLV
ncbi:hypothetical protein HCN44_007017 [Aphidius gifuensis]|uniref:Uncharacterized protein n=1 Tax=Aphidius gifuensis TaxID=684658 RepID=A0A834XYI5_APHGI|nr:hypothetical protein HCN44_007017 [Aphidius gifuensis]